MITRLQAIYSELAGLTGIRFGIYPPAGPLTIPFATSKSMRALARTVGLSVVGKCILFVINSEQDLPRVFNEVRSLARELNNAKKVLTPTIFEAMGNWTSQPTEPGQSPVKSMVGPDSGLGVLTRHISITPNFLEGLLLLGDVFAQWEPAKYGIYAPRGPLTVVLRGSAPVRIIARTLGFLGWEACDVMPIMTESDAAKVLGSIQVLASKIADIIAAIPDGMEGFTGGVE